MQFQFFDIVLWLGIVQAVFLSLALRRIEGGNQSINRALIQMLLVTAYVLAGRLIIKHHIAWSFFRWLAFTDSIIFLFGLLNYVFIRRILVPSAKPYRPSWKHYIPLVICSGVFLSLNFIGAEQYRAWRSAGVLFWTFNLFELVGLLSNMIYLSLSFGLLIKFRKATRTSVPAKGDLFHFLLFYLLALGLSVMLWAVCYVNLRYFSIRIPYISYDMIWITIPFFVYSVAYFSLRKPALFRITHSVPSVNPSIRRLTEMEVRLMKTALERLMKEDKVYMQNDLTLRELAVMLDTSPNNLSWLLNNEYKASFYDFVNQHRITEFLNLVHNHASREQTILALAMEVGFNSKSTFNKVFKAQKSVTPTEYIKNLSEVA